MLNTTRDLHLKTHWFKQPVPRIGFNLMKNTPWARHYVMRASPHSTGTTSLHLPTHPALLSQPRYHIRVAGTTSFSLTVRTIRHFREHHLTTIPVSENICPEMVVLDDAHNGWRQQILPIACADEMVLKCVLSVSSFHLSSRAPNQIIIGSPREHFLQAIGELQSRRCLDQCDLQTKQFVIVAIILLLAAVMVNGCSDFRILFHMLQSALDSIGGEEGLADGELASFLRREIHK